MAKRRASTPPPNDSRTPRPVQGTELERLRHNFYMTAQVRRGGRMCSDVAYRICLLPRLSATVTDVSVPANKRRRLSAACAPVTQVLQLYLDDEEEDEEGESDC